MHRAFKMEWSDVQVVTLAVSATFLIEDEDDMVVCNGIKRRHQYWMAPYLRDRTDSTQRNTMPKLEMHMIEVSTCGR